MKNTSYSNINLDFTFENVCSKLTTFWLNEVMTLNKSKVWLTIRVLNRNNRSFTLLTNLPFSTSEYTDVVIVLRQIFDTKFLSERQDILDRIDFEYYFEDKKSIYKK